MEKCEKVVLTNICMVYKGNKVLVQERTKKDWPGLTFPGGHVEKGENFHDAVVREVKEETGLELKNPILCGIEEFKQLNKEDRHIILYYKCNKFKGRLKSSKEGKVFWIERKDLLKANLSLDLDRMIKIMESDKLSELIYYKENGEYKSVIK
ncbi:MAG: 8-oxo-dGTP diphosphatase [Erysipelotrichaceae bacterium]|nr:8-oxo-dGTP diphosphatase [Erysipelotrichaceae bacterium]